MPNRTHRTGVKPANFALKAAVIIPTITKVSPRMRKKTITRFCAIAPMNFSMDLIPENCATENESFVAKFVGGGRPG